MNELIAGLMMNILEKHFFPTKVTEEGIEISVSEEQFSKQQSPILLNEEQFLKELFPISSTEEEIEILMSD